MNMVKFNKEDFMNGALAVNCATEEIADNFLNILHGAGIKWGGGQPIKELYTGKVSSEWAYYKAKTTYHIVDGGVQFASLDYYIEDGLDIITWNDKCSHSTDLHADVIYRLITTGSDYKLTNGTLVFSVPECKDMWTEHARPDFYGTFKPIAFNEYDKIKGEKEMETNKRVKLGELQEGCTYDRYKGDDLYDLIFGVEYRLEKGRLESRRLRYECEFELSNLTDMQKLNSEFVLKSEPNKETGWFDKENKGHTDGRYYYLREDGDVCTYGWENDGTDTELFEIANCFRTREKAKEESDKDTLRRLMQRFADENNEGEIDWENPKQSKYKVFYNHSLQKYNVVDNVTWEDLGVPYFTSDKIAGRCIAEIILPFGKAVN